MSDTDLLLAAVQSELSKVRTAIAGTVVSYDHTTQKATVQVAVRDKVRAARGGAIENVDVPLLANVPVVFPRATGYADTFPLSAGDSVWIMFAYRSLDEWKTTGGATNDAQDVRRFDLSDAVCIPGETSFARPVAATGRATGARVIEAPELRLGSSAASSAVTLDVPLQAALTALKDAIAAAPIIAGDGGASFKASLIAALAAWPGTTGATKVKAE